MKSNYNSLSSTTFKLTVKNGCSTLVVVLGLVLGDRREGGVCTRGVLARLEDRCNNTVAENQSVVLAYCTKFNTMNRKGSLPMSIYLRW